MPSSRPAANRKGKQAPGCEIPGHGNSDQHWIHYLIPLRLFQSHLCLICFRFPCMHISGFFLSFLSTNCITFCLLRSKCFSSIKAIHFASLLSLFATVWTETRGWVDAVICALYTPHWQSPRSQSFIALLKTLQIIYNKTECHRVGGGQPKTPVCYFSTEVPPASDAARPWNDARTVMWRIPLVFVALKASCFFFCTRSDVRQPRGRDRRKGASRATSPATHDPRAPRGASVVVGMSSEKTLSP